jgi:periplasmic divalent cation tolerance protein
MAVSQKHCVIVFITTADAETAAAIGRALVEERLAACANLLGPIRSIYRWRGAVEEASEHLLLVKTQAGRYRALEARVKELHPYDVPEIIAVDIESGSLPYLDWVRESTNPTPVKPGRKAARSKR